MKKLATAAIGLAMAFSVSPTAHSQSLEYIDGTSSRVSGSVATGSLNFQTSVSDAVAGSTGMKRSWENGVAYDVVAFREVLNPGSEWEANRCGIKIRIDSDSYTTGPDRWWLIKDMYTLPVTTDGDDPENLFFYYEPWDSPPYSGEIGLNSGLYFGGDQGGTYHWVGEFSVLIPEVCPVPSDQTEVVIDSGWAERME